MAKLEQWEFERLSEVSRSLRKCYLLDSAKLAHGVQVLVYAPEAFENEGYLHADTRVSVFVEGEPQPRMTCIVDTRTERVEDILERHGKGA